MQDRGQFSAYKSHKRDGAPLTIRRLIYGSMNYRPEDGRLFLPKEEMPSRAEITAILIEVGGFAGKYFHHFDLARVDSVK